MEAHLNNFICQYGYLGIFLALSGGVIGLPIPDEVLMTFVGYQVHKGYMFFAYSFLSAYAGACIGSTISYFIGYKLGLPVLKKLGPKIKITEERLEKGQHLLKKYGSIWITVGYFIPGIRHINGYLSGVGSLSYARFALYAFTGSFMWCLTFMGIGYFFQRESYFILKALRENVSVRIAGAIVLVLIMVAIYYAYMRFKQKRTANRQPDDKINQ